MTAPEALLPLIGPRLYGLVRARLAGKRIYFPKRDGPPLAEKLGRLYPNGVSEESASAVAKRLGCTRRYVYRLSARVYNSPRKARRH